MSSPPGGLTSTIADLYTDGDYEKATRLIRLVLDYDAQGIEAASSPSSARYSVEPGPASERDAPQNPSLGEHPELSDAEIERVIDTVETDLRIVHGNARFDPATFAHECLRYARDRGLLSPKGELTYVMSKEPLDDFEVWLRTECFQVPPKHSYDLAKAAWKASRLSSGEQPQQELEAPYLRNEVAARIKEEHRKYGGRTDRDFDWTLIAAAKVIATIRERDGHPLYSRPTTPREGEELVRAASELLKLHDIKTHIEACNATDCIPDDDKVRYYLEHKPGAWEALRAALPKDTGGTTLQR